MSISKFIKEKMPGLVPIIMFLRVGTNKTMDKWSTKQLKKVVMHHYKERMGYSFDIENPVTFTEKIQWYKLYYERDDFANIVDKVLFKQYIADKVGAGYTIPMFGAWDNIEDFEKAWFAKDSVIPEEFVLKANLQSDGRNIKIIHNKSSVDFLSLKKEIASWLEVKNTLMNSGDCHFYKSKPMILAEEYMSNFEDQLYDWKFFCFNGKVYCIYVAQDHFGQDGSHISFYDVNWNKLDVQYGDHIIGDAPKPIHFDEMKVLAEKLSKGFPFLRVDFFDTDEKLYLAELTFNPGGGFVPYHPESFNKELGDQFILPK